METDANTAEVTTLLRRSREGDVEVNNRLFQLIYQHLKKVAIAYMKNERPGHTLQPTALVNEAYLRIFGPAVDIDWESRAHFYGIAAKQMRQILIDHARKKRAEKRGQGVVLVTLSHADGARDTVYDFEDLEEALAELERKAPGVARLVELKFLAGLKDKEIGGLMNISFARVRRDWEFGRAFLLSRLK